MKPWHCFFKYLRRGQNNEELHCTVLQVEKLFHYSRMFFSPSPPQCNYNRSFLVTFLIYSTIPHICEAIWGNIIVSKFKFAYFAMHVPWNRQFQNALFLFYYSQILCNAVYDSQHFKIAQNVNLSCSVYHNELFCGGWINSVFSYSVIFTWFKIYLGL